MRRIATQTSRSNKGWRNGMKCFGNLKAENGRRRPNNYWGWLANHTGENTRYKRSWQICTPMNPDVWAGPYCLASGFSFTSSFESKQAGKERPAERFDHREPSESRGAFHRLTFNLASNDVPYSGARSFRVEYPEILCVTPHGKGNCVMNLHTLIYEPDIRTAVV